MRFLDPFMTVPRLAGAVPKLNEAHAALEQPPRDQRLPAMNPRAIHLSNRFRLATDIKRIDRVHLHAERQLKGLNSGFESRITLPRVFMLFIEISQQIKL